MNAPLDVPRLPRSNSRFYQLGNRKLWRVTSLLGAMNKPALVPWAANLEREACIATAIKLLENPPPGLNADNYAAAFELALGSAKAHQKETQKAQDIGSLAHHRCEWILRGRVGPEPTSEFEHVQQPALWASMAAEDWLTKHEFVPRFVEQTIWSDHHGYAGTMDAYGEATLPGIGRCNIVLDFKTGKAVYAEARLQVSAYRQALIEMGHAARPLHAVVLRLPKVTTDPAFEAVVLHDAELHELFPTFLAVGKVFEFQEAQDEAWRAKRKPAA